jgi:hypothetical protein
MRSVLVLASLLLASIVSCYAEADCECDFIKKTPVTNAANYQPLCFQSGQGKDCLKYQVKNGKDGIFMPVHWAHAKYVLFDFNIPAGQTEWLDVCHTAYQHDTGETKFAYGVNKAQFSDKPETYRPAGKAVAPGNECEPDQVGFPKGKGKKVPDGPSKGDGKPTFPPLVTAIKGTVALTSEKSVKVDLKVVSSYDDKNKTIKHEILVGGDSTTFAFLAEKEKYGGKEVRILWDSINHQTLLDEYKTKWPFIP